MPHVLKAAYCGLAFFTLISFAEAKGCPPTPQEGEAACRAFAADFMKDHPEKFTFLTLRHFMNQGATITLDQKSYGFRWFRHEDIGSKTVSALGRVGFSHYSAPHCVFLTYAADKPESPVSMEFFSLLCESKKTETTSQKKG